MASKPNHWLLKTEPSTYSFDHLIHDKKTNWNGVRNFQARNFIREMKQGDVALIYHSGDDKAVMGVAQISKAPYPDPDPDMPGEWLQVDLVPQKRLSRSVPLSELKAHRELAQLKLIRQSRLSSMPITPREYEIICEMGSKTAPAASKKLTRKTSKK